MEAPGFFLLCIRVGSTAKRMDNTNRELIHANAHLFDPVTGEYRPKWRDEDVALIPTANRILFILWEHHIREKIVPAMVQAGRSNSTIYSIVVPDYIYKSWCVVFGEHARMLGYPLESGPGFLVNTFSPKLV